MKRGWCTRNAGTLLEHWGRYVPDRPIGKCWGWSGQRDKDGYGKICHDGKHMRGHRVSYELHVGKIPGGLFVLHSCDNPSCVNPHHLFVGTNVDNMIDMVKKERGPRQKLSPHNVLEIRQMLADGAKAEVIAKKFTIHPYTVRRIKNGKRWGHLIEAAA